MSGHFNRFFTVNSSSSPLSRRAIMSCVLCLLIILYLFSDFADAIQSSKSNVRTLPVVPPSTKFDGFLIRNAEMRDIEFVSRLVTKELTSFSQVTLL